MIVTHHDRGGVRQQRRLEHFSRLRCGHRYVVQPLERQRRASLRIHGHSIISPAFAGAADPVGTSQCAQEVHESWLLAPVPARHLWNRALAQRLGLHGEIDLGVDVGGVQGQASPHLRSSTRRPSTGPTSSRILRCSSASVTLPSVVERQRGYAPALVDPIAGEDGRIVEAGLTTRLPCGSIQIYI